MARKKKAVNVPRAYGQKAESCMSYYLSIKLRKVKKSEQENGFQPIFPILRTMFYLHPTYGEIF